MSVIALADLAHQPDVDATQGERDRYRLLSTVAGALGITSRHPTPAEWAHAVIPADAAGDLRAAIDTEGRRTDRHRVAISGRSQFRSMKRHPDRARTQLLDRLDRLYAEVTDDA